MRANERRRGSESRGLPEKALHPPAPLATPSSRGPASARAIASAGVAGATPAPQRMMSPPWPRESDGPVSVLQATPAHSKEAAASCTVVNPPSKAIQHEAVQ